MNSMTEVPNGIPGLKTRMPLLMAHGVMAGRIDIHTFVALTATQPARLYGLAPSKGSTAIGADADLIDVPPEQWAAQTAARA